MISWEVKHYDELSKEELYDLLALRIEVFVVEQNCPYQDLDDKDQYCWHVLGKQNGKVVATSRIVPAGMVYDEVAIGRVANAKVIRGSGAGREMMVLAIDYILNQLNEGRIRISAQEYLEKFYKSLGFIATEERYLEDGIPHVEMFLTH